MKYDAVINGYVSMDHIIKVSSPAQNGYTSIVTNSDHNKIYYGGCSVNIAVALCRLGRKVLPILRVGSDYESCGFKDFLEKSNVPLEGISILPQETTSSCYLIEDNHNEHITIYYPGSMDKKYAVSPQDSFFQNAGLGIITVASKPDNEFFLKQCEKYQVPVVFGMKDDFDAFPVEFLKKILIQSRIIFMNETEREIIEKLFGCSSVSRLFEIGKAETIITTMGEAGSICYHKNESAGMETYQINACPVDKVVDVTGAGDAYMAGFLYGYLNRKPVKECCCLGSALSSFVLQGIGCCTNIPEKAELEEKVEMLHRRCE